MRKILLVIAVVLAALLAVAAYLALNLDAVVHSRIERTGSRIAGVPVTVGSVEISLARGTATITDLTVANPPGFSDEPAMRFGEISATIKVVSGVITRVYAGRPVIRVEGEPRRTNLDVLRGNAAPDSAPGGTATDSGGTGSGANTTSTGGGQDRSDSGAEDEESSDTYEIERVEISQASVLVDLEGMNEPEQLDIDELVFTDLSGTRSRITRQILRQLTDDVMAAVERRVVEAAGEAAREEIEKRADELKERARSKLEELLQGN